jgi:hypothetical protein
MSKLACAILALVGFVALLVVQTNVTWGDTDSGGSHKQARTWGQTTSGGGFLFAYSGSQSWYDSGWSSQDKNAVNQLQVAAPLVLAGLLLLLVGAILSFTAPGAGGPITTLIGGLLTAAGTVLYFLAIQDLYNNNQTWQTGFYLAVAGTVLGLAGGVVGMAAGNRRAYST